MVEWSPENEARLMMAYIEATDAKLGSEGWKTIADKLGGGVTASAISQRFTKVLKKKYGGANCAIGSDGDSTVKTPKSRGRKQKDAEAMDKTPHSSSRKRGAKAVAEEDDDEIPDSPTKKVKEEMKKEKSFFDEEDGTDF
ncbi:rna polymerase-associated protein ctr9 [Diplodia corticola]|uniref:Rna polymerase-associated protein ctr9 n=1 Tax=Diplodia corticola TaxID=236234 RepID=A0A1J9S8L1_9PEZI|nr:rna polymerase-associated protein ctr9 [Diplodia corticola]OJD36847.1 rna polymerase-associated protein ctr9 [Diplodia corticola]